MAFSGRTKLVVLVLANFIVRNYCENDFSVPKNYATDSVQADLLRGSNESTDEEDTALPLNMIKDTEDGSKRETEQTVHMEHTNVERYDDHEPVSQPRASIDRNYDTITKYTTTEYPITTTNVPEYMPSAQKLENTDDKHDYSNNEKTDRTDADSAQDRERRQEGGNVEKVEKTERNAIKRQYDKADDENAEATTLEMTETATDTLSTIDNNVYNAREQDIYNNSDVETKTEVSPQTTARVIYDMDVAVPKIAEFADEVDVSMQRNPKTENRDSHQPPERRTYEQPRPTPAVNKSSTLKGWLEDSWLRPPAGILVPLRPMALNRALAVWNDLTSVGALNVSDIVIIGYDSRGVNWRSRHNLQGTGRNSGNRAVSEALSKLLLKYQGVYSETNNDGTMRALASAAKLVPYDSALFIITDKGAGDVQRLPLALRALVEKRLKVYTIWTDPNYPSAESESALQELRNVSSHTEGDVLPYSLQVMDVDEENLALEMQQWAPMETIQSRRPRIKTHTGNGKYDTLLVRRGGGGAISLGIPVENGVSAIRILIEGAVEHAVLYPPNEGPQIDLYNKSSVRAFSAGSKTESLTPRDVYLIFPQARTAVDTLSVLPPSALSDSPEATVGIWHLSVRCDTCDYRLAVLGKGQVHFDAKIDKKEMLKLRVNGPVASVRQSLLIDEFGTELAKLPFSYQPIGIEDQEELFEDPLAELIADVPLPTIKGSRIYAKIVGRDVRGAAFTRLSGPLNQPEVRTSRSAEIVFPDSASDLELAEQENSIIYNSKLRYNDSSFQAYTQTSAQVVNQQGSLLTAVQIGLSSRLYGAPGDNLQLHFEVTNYRDFRVFFEFGARDELKFLRGINPRSQNVESGQTVNVIIQVGITRNAQPGARDLVIFTAYRNGQAEVTMSTYVYVIDPTQLPTDVRAPDVRHNFQGTCLSRQGDDCAQHVWSATIIARDATSGLLRLSSSPTGMVYDSNFVSGSKEEVTATYRATCCAPRVVVTAVDTFGNANSYTIDISNYLNEATIAAIVLGVLLAIALILLVIFLIYLCVKKRRESRELPYTTATRNLS